MTDWEGDSALFWYQGTFGRGMFPHLTYPVVLRCLGVWSITVKRGRVLVHRLLSHFVLRRWQTTSE